MLHFRLEQGQSSLALNKISSRPFSPDPFGHSQQHQIPLTKGYVAAANRNLAASTLRVSVINYVADTYSGLHMPEFHRLLSYKKQVV